MEGSRYLGSCKVTQRENDYGDCRRTIRPKVGVTPETLAPNPEANKGLVCPRHPEYLAVPCVTCIPTSAHSKAKSSTRSRENVFEKASSEHKAYTKINKNFKSSSQKQ